MENLKIQEYSEEYQEQVKNLVISIHEEFGFPYDFNIDYDLENPKKIYTNSGGIFFVLLNGEKVVGTVAIKKINGNTAELKRMYLLKNYRGKGWGSKLLDKAIEFCKKEGFGQIGLDTNVKQVGAQKLYGKKGFNIYKTKRNTIFMFLDLKNTVS